MRSAVVPLAPSAHERVRRGFVGTLIDAAARSGFSGYVGDGAQRWPVLHGVGDTGVPLKAIAATIGAGLQVPVRSMPSELATEHFGRLGTLVGTDAPASSDATRELLGWRPSHPGLLDDLARGDFFPSGARPAGGGGQP